MSKDSLGSLLIRKGRIRQSQLMQALNLQKTRGCALEEVLLELKYITQEELQELKQDSRRTTTPPETRPKRPLRPSEEAALRLLNYEQLTQRYIPQDLLDIIPYGEAQRHPVLLFGIQPKRQELVLVITEKLPNAIYDWLLGETECRQLRSFFATREDLSKAIRYHYGRTPQTQESLPSSQSKFVGTAASNSHRVSTNHRIHTLAPQKQHRLPKRRPPSGAKQAQDASETHAEVPRIFPTESPHTPTHSLLSPKTPAQQTHHGKELPPASHFMSRSSSNHSTTHFSADEKRRSSSLQLQSHNAEPPTSSSSGSFPFLVPLQENSKTTPFSEAPRPQREHSRPAFSVVLQPSSENADIPSPSSFSGLPAIKNDPAHTLQLEQDEDPNAQTLILIGGFSKSPAFPKLNEETPSKPQTDKEKAKISS